MGSPKPCLFVLFTCLLLFCEAANQWNCPSNSNFCFQRIHHLQSWNEARIQCAALGAQLPGAEHLEDMRTWKQTQAAPFWTSLCISRGRLQWFGSDPIEERDLTFIDALLPELTMPYVRLDVPHCYYAEGDLAHTYKPFGMTLVDGEQLMSVMCATDKKVVNRPTLRKPQGRIIAAEVVSLGADIDWGPVGQSRLGFMNIFPPKHSTLKLKCDAKTTDPDVPVEYRWRRNGGYMGNNSQIIDFQSEEGLVKWTGSISCEAVEPGDAVGIPGQGFHLVVWNTYTLRLITDCVECSIQKLVDSAKVTLTEFVEAEINPGMKESMEFFLESPVIKKTSLSIIMHVRNKKIDKFDYKMSHKLGDAGLFVLSNWAKDQQLISSKAPNMLVETISPCNNALPEDRYTNNTWIGYPGQIVPSNNFIGGPICVDRDGEIITRSCGLSIPNEFKECAALKPRREEPICAHGFVPVKGRCFRMTGAVDHTEALSQCWAGWKNHNKEIQVTLPDWIQGSMEWIGRTKPYLSSPLVWLPFRRPNLGSTVQKPIWTWNDVSMEWIEQPSVNINLMEKPQGYEGEECTAFDLERGHIVSQPCKKQLPMICTQPTLPKDVSVQLNSQPDHLGEYFCPSGWITHALVMDTGLCYKRVEMKDAVTWDEAREECMSRGGDLAMAPEHTLRVALEQSYGFFNNKSLVDSWIGMHNPGEKPGVMRWANETIRSHPAGETYTWQGYSEFGAGYGVSTGLTRMWWNWPKEVKIWGMMCQKTVSDQWKEGLRLRLEESDKKEIYDLTFTYDAPAYYEEGANQTFWQSEVDVVCHFANHAQHLRLEANRPVQISIPSSFGPGPLNCGAWLNRPAHRFYSNTIIHNYNHPVEIPGASPAPKPRLREFVHGGRRNYEGMNGHPYPRRHHSGQWGPIPQYARYHY